jgi:hypothetical protein
VIATQQYFQQWSLIYSVFPDNKHHVRHAKLHAFVVQWHSCWVVSGWQTTDELHLLISGLLNTGAIWPSWWSRFQIHPSLSFRCKTSHNDIKTVVPGLLRKAELYPVPWSLLTEHNVKDLREYIDLGNNRSSCMSGTYTDTDWLMAEVCRWYCLVIHTKWWLMSTTWKCIYKSCWLTCRWTVRMFQHPWKCNALLCNKLCITQSDLLSTVTRGIHQIVTLLIQ